MALKGILIALLAGEAATLADAFASPYPRGAIASRPTARFGTVRPDASEAIADALRATEVHGATSKEARVAWDIVEEMDSNDGSAAYADGTNAVDAPTDYRDHIRSLSHLLEETHSKLAQMKELVTQLKAMELKDPSLSRLPDGASSDALKAALADAKAAVAVYGASSPEAKEAWDKLDHCFGGGGDGVLALAEECDIETSTFYRYSAAALKAHHMYDAAIETAVLDESLEALGMIQGLQTFVTVEKRRLDAREGSAGP